MNISKHLLIKIVSEELSSILEEQYDTSKIVDFFRGGATPSSGEIEEPVEKKEPQDYKSFICKFLKAEEGSDITSSDPFKKELETFPEDKQEKILDLFIKLSGNKELERKFCGDPEQKSGVIRVFGKTNKRSLEFKIRNILSYLNANNVSNDDIEDLALQISKDIATQLMFNKIKVVFPSGKILEQIQYANPENRKIISLYNDLLKIEDSTKNKISRLETYGRKTGKKFNKNLLSQEQQQEYDRLKQKIERIKNLKNKAFDRVTQAQKRTLPGGGKKKDGKKQSYASEITRQKAKPEIGKIKVSIPLFTRLKAKGYDQKQVVAIRKMIFRMLQDTFKKAGVDLPIYENKKVRG